MSNSFAAPLSPEVHAVDSNSGLFRHLVECSPSALLLLNQQGEILLVNAAAEVLFGYPRRQLLGATVEILIPERLRAAHPALRQAFLSNPSARPMGVGRELNGRRSDGTEFPLEIGLTPIDAAEGQLVLASVIDISRIRQAEQRFRHIVESSPNAMLVIDQQRNITFINRKAEEVFGYDRKDLIGKPLEILLPERYRALHPAMVAGFHRSPSTRPMGAERALFARRSDGVEIPVEIGLNPIEGLDGGATLACIIDISERKRVENDLRRSNADLEQFAYVASHDLQEPLRMVANFTELLSQRYQGQLDAKADKYLHFANDGAKRMQRLVADLLQYSRVGSQGKPKVRTAMQKVVEGVLHLLEAPLQHCDARVDVGVLPSLTVDEGQMRQLFQNLIGNAIKFRSETPLHLRIEAQPIDETSWQFSVSDNGIGLDTAFADKVFQMFQRLHELGRYEGSGIGLAIAKRIVERHGGRIWVDSALGAGATFHFTLRA
ncbi:PAS domain S-box protein [Duganella sp. FT94W]|uniref:histidine kinase n=1 Tax=Duganella lactea TaxID=2692173 RepID=A0ABW9VBP8_9BURK|nr:PAS domain S-box protein [Duganella lactea]MYM35057.1 PAS domain S-box protein [Duganella lactea]